MTDEHERTGMDPIKELEAIESDLTVDVRVRRRISVILAGLDAWKPEKGEKSDDCPHEQIVALYHEMLPELPRVRAMTSKRKSWLRARWNGEKKRQSLDYWRRYFGFVRECPFLMGQNGRGWTADFEWLVNEANFTKVIEGKYAEVRA